MHDDDGRDAERTQVCVVEATDHTGRLIDRTAFETEVEAEEHAAAMRSKGYKVEQSSMAPKTADPS